MGFYAEHLRYAAYHARWNPAIPHGAGYRIYPAYASVFLALLRLYDTAVSHRHLDDVRPADPKINRLLWMLRKAGILDQTDDLYRIHDTRAIWIHLLQNSLLLEYINTVWTEAKRTAFPERIRLRNHKAS